MDQIKKYVMRKEFLIGFIIAAFFLVYALFFKPNPWLRINVNKLQAAKAESALTIEAPKEVDGVGRKFKVNIVMDTFGNSVNAVQSYLEFDPKVLEIISTTTEQSFCKFYPENNYNNEKGQIKLSCGTPYPGFRGVNTLEVIEFSAKAIQTTTLKLTADSMVLANDGKGTNLLKDIPSAEIKIKAGL